MLRFLSLFVLAIGCSPGSSVYADEKPVLNIKGWGDIIDPDKDCQVRLDEGKLMVKVPGAAHDFAAELGRWNAPRILSEVRGDFIIDVQVSGEFKPVEASTIDTRRSYNGAGILLVKDRNNHLSLQRGAVHLGDRVRHYANFELRKDAELRVSLYELELEDKDTYLRLERRGTKVYGMTSHDGINWRSYDPIEVDFPQVISVGVEIINSSKQPFACAFENLALYRKVESRAAKP
jgi:regulation of enolase protein 1 (concanavalin A-like superfamily)